jgi:hypothetical protein
VKADALLRHDYTLGGVETLARHAVMGNRQYWSGGNRLDQHEVARFAILEALYAAEEQPQPADLLHAAQRALSRDKETEMRTHGIPVSSRETGERFATYWLSDRVTGSPEGGVVEAMALQQIFPILPVNHQQALLALAATGDQRAAAELMGVGVNTFYTWIQRGRAAFRVLWHEGEAPSKPWGRDCRSTSTRHGASAMSKLRRRARTQTKEA